MIFRSARRRSGSLALSLVGFSLALLSLAPSSALAFDCSDLLNPPRKNSGCSVLKPGSAAATWQRKGDAITVKLLLNATQDALQWAAFGLSQTGSMKGADVWLIYKAAAGGTWAVTDAMAFDFARPVPDKVQNVKLRSMSYSAKQQVWTAVLSRKLKTCDAASDLAIEPGLSTYLMWAFGSTSKKGFQGIMYHGTDNRGSRLDMLAQAPSKGLAAAASATATPLATTDAPAQPAVPTAAEIAQAVDAIVTGTVATTMSEGPPTTAAATATTGPPRKPEVVDNGDGTFTTKLLCPVPALPTKATTYMYCYVSLPDDQEYKAIEFEAIFGSKLVHHSVLYSCPAGSAQSKVESILETQGPGPFDRSPEADGAPACFSIFMTPPSPVSARPVFVVPPETGMIFGRGSFKYLVIETHYNNPEALAGESDPLGTGLRLKFVLSSQRKHALGVLTLGQYLFDLPPGRKTVQANTTTCPSACTSRFKQPLTLVAQRAHMHGAGKAVITRHIRGNTELEPLLNLRQFDYDFQAVEDVPASGTSTLLPGDTLSLTCVYDTSDRKNTTRFGTSTQEEMCFNWLFYYPAQDDMGLCSTLGNTNLALRSPGYEPVEALVIAVDAEATNKEPGAVTKTVMSLMKAGQALMTPPRPPLNTAWNSSQGCSAEVPA